MNVLQELTMELYEDYKKELKDIEKTIIEKAKAGESCTLELEKARFKNIQIKECLLMFAERGD